MTPNETIAKAITEGGFIGHPLADWHEHDKHEILLDPLFWQALGKSMGWGNTNVCGHCRSNLYDSYERKEDKMWHYYWLSFIDHLAEGGSVESYFANL